MFIRFSIFVCIVIALNYVPIGVNYRQCMKRTTKYNCITHPVWVCEDFVLALDNDVSGNHICVCVVVGLMPSIG